MFAELLHSLTADGMAVLLVEHDVGLVMDVCTSIHVIDYGALVAVGTPAEIRSNQAVLDAYLGDGTARIARIDANASDRRGRLGHARRREERPRYSSFATSRPPYGKIEVLHGVDVVLPRGNVVALLGPNGSGKSTTLKVASGQMQPTGGCIHLGGRHVNGAAGQALSRIGLCTIPEGRGVFPNLTVRENLVMASYVGLPLGPIEERTYTFFPRLAERRSQLAGTLSGGEQRMLAMARALVSEPAVLLLDEMSMGLAPLIVEELYSLVGDIAAVRHLDPHGRAVRAHRARRRGSRDRHGAGKDRRVGPPCGHQDGTVGGLLGSESMSDHEVSSSDGGRSRRIASSSFSPTCTRSRFRAKPNDASTACYVAGIVITLAGFAAIGLGWWGASGTKYVYQEIPYVVSGGLFGVALVFVGAALFARYSAARLLRFWLARLVADQQIQTDHVVAAIAALAEATRTQTIASDDDGQ